MVADRSCPECDCRECADCVCSFFHETERRMRVQLAALESANRHLRALAAEQDSWRLAATAWQAWAADLLVSIGLQLDGGEWGDEVAREKLRAAVATMTPLCDAAEEWEREFLGEETSYDLRLKAAIEQYRAVRPIWRPNTDGKAVPGMEGK